MHPKVSQALVIVVVCASFACADPPSEGEGEGDDGGGEGEGEGEGEGGEGEGEGEGEGDLPACEPALTVDPPSAQVLPLGLLVLTPSGGTGAYRFDLATDASGALLDPLSGVYLSGSTTGVHDLVRVSDDGCSGAVDVDVEVVAPLALVPGNAEAPPTTAFRFDVVGGSRSFSFALLASGSGGTLDDDGAYVAGATDGDDTVEVTDLVTGETADAVVHVRAGAVIVANPPQWLVPVGASVVVGTAGGSGVVDLTVASGEGSVDVDGQNVDGAAPGAAVLNVVDHYTRQSTTVNVRVSPAQAFTLPRSGDASQLSVVAAPGDIDGDGRPDVVIGVQEMNYSGDGSLGPGGINAGAVYVWGSADLGSPRVVGGADRRDQMGRAVVVADVNGDGRSDLIVGAPQQDVGLVDNGVVTIFFGQDEASGGGFASTPSKVLTGPFGGDRFGTALAVCDFDGDGLTDLAVSAPNGRNRDLNPAVNNQGAVHVFKGYPDGFLERADVVVFGVVPAADGSGPVAAANLFLGTWLAGADLDDDGRCDLIASSTAFSSASGRSNDGALFIYRGEPAADLDPGGVESLPVRVLAGTAADDPGSTLGRRFVTADLDGDTVPEIVVTQHNHDEPAPLGGNVGAVLVIEGLVLGVTPAAVVEDVESVASATYLGTNGGDNFGHDVSVCDVDGDGKVDLIVSGLFDEGTVAPVVNNTGAVSVFAGVANAFPSTTATTVFAGAADSDRFGESISFVGDVDGDGDNDIAVFAGTDDDNGFNVGVPFLVSADETTRLVLPGNAGGSEIGRGAAVVSDVDGDGKADLVVGAPEVTLDPQGTSTGVLELYRGQAGGTFSTTPDREWKLFPGHTSGDRLGFAVVNAGDFDNDGRGDFAVLGRSDDRPATFDANHEGGSTCQGTINNSGSVWIFSGARAFSENAPSWLYFQASQPNQNLLTLAGGFDWNGDGRDDVALGTVDWDRPGNINNVGGVEIVFGRAAGTASKISVICDADARFLGVLGNDNAGRSITALKDVDNDGCDELVVGANGEDLGKTDQGSLRVLFGAGASCATTTMRVLTLVSDEQGAQGGFAVAGGDVDGDGIADLAVGGFNHRRGADTAGIVWLIKGARLRALANQAETLVDAAAPARTFPFVDPADTDRLFIEGQNGADRIGNALAMVARGTRFDVVIGVSQGGASGGQAAVNTGGARVFPVDDNGFVAVPRAIFAGETFRKGGLLGDFVGAGVADGKSVVLMGGFQGSGTGLDEGALHAGALE